MDEMRKELLKQLKADVAFVEKSIGMMERGTMTLHEQGASSEPWENVTSEVIEVYRRAVSTAKGAIRDIEEAAPAEEEVGTATKSDLAMRIEALVPGSTGVVQVVADGSEGGWTVDTARVPDHLRPKVIAVAEGLKEEYRLDSPD